VARLSNAGSSLAIVLTLAGGVAMLVGGIATAEPPQEHGGPAGHGGPAEHRVGEPHPGPRGYERVTEPHGWNARPPAVDHDAYQHNFQASRSFRIGPYHPPAGLGCSPLGLRPDSAAGVLGLSVCAR
jgi:hypothetical protein